MTPFAAELLERLREPRQPVRNLSPEHKTARATADGYGEQVDVPLVPYFAHDEVAWYDDATGADGIDLQARMTGGALGDLYLAVDQIIAAFGQEWVDDETAEYQAKLGWPD